MELEPSSVTIQNPSHWAGRECGLHGNQGRPHCSHTGPNSLHTRTHTINTFEDSGDHFVVLAVNRKPLSHLNGFSSHSETFVPLRDEKRKKQEESFGSSSPQSFSRYYGNGRWVTFSFLTLPLCFNLSTSRRIMWSAVADTKHQHTET